MLQAAVDAERGQAVRHLHRNALFRAQTLQRADHRTRTGQAGTGIVGTVFTLAREPHDDGAGQEAQYDLGEDGRDVISEAVLMLSYGASVGHSQYLQHYLIQTAIGALAGVSVNFIIPPPLQVRRAHNLVREVSKDTADLLGHIADGLREGYGESETRTWQRDVDALDAELGVAVEALWDGAESRRFNPRRRHSPVPQPQAYRPMLRAMPLVMSSVSSIVRTLAHTAGENEETPDAPSGVSESFAHAYAELLGVIAGAIAAQGRDPASSEEEARRHATTSLEKASAIHERMTGLVRDGKLSRPGAWAISGSLLVDAERVVSALTWCADDLAAAR